MQDVKWIDYLKGARSGGRDRLRHVRLADLYEDYYVKSKGNQFRALHDELPMAGLSNRYQSYINTISRLGNPDLTWEKRKEITAGIDVLLLRKRLAGGQLLQHEARGHHHQHEFRTAETLRHGRHRHPRELQRHPLSGAGEAALYWSDRIGKVDYTAGGSISTLKGKYLRYTENVVYDYQRHGIGDGFPTGGCLRLGKVHLAGGDRHLAPPALRRRSSGRRPEIRRPEQRSGLSTATTRG